MCSNIKSDNKSIISSRKYLQTMGRIFQHFQFNLLIYDDVDRNNFNIFEFRQVVSLYWN